MAWVGELQEKAWIAAVREMSEPHDFEPEDFQPGAFATGALYEATMAAKNERKGILVDKGWKGVLEVSG